MSRSSGGIFLNICIQQIKVDSPDMQLPDLGKDFATQKRHRHEQNLIVAHDFAEREMVKVLVQIDRFLPTILVDQLLEIAVTVEQSDRDKVQVEIARRLAVIA